MTTPVATQVAGVTVRLEIEGTDLPDDWYDSLVELRVERELRLPGRATVRLHDPTYALLGSPKLHLGNEVVIKAVDRRQKSTVLLAGLVTGLASESSLDGHEIVLTVHDRAESLGRGTVVDTYLGRTASQVVSEIARRHGLTAKVQATTEALDYLLQLDTDLQMLDALADRAGHDWWVEGKELHFARPAPRGTVEVTMGDALVRFDVRASGLRPDHTVHAGYDRAGQEVVREAEQEQAGQDVVNGPELFRDYRTPGRALGPDRVRTLVGTGDVVRSRVEAQQRSTALRDRLGAGAVSATAVLLSAMEVVPGTDLKVAGVGAASGTYHVTRVEHRYREYFETVATAGDRRPASLVDTLSGAPAGSSTPPLVVGTVTAVGKPGDAASRGRVKVRFEGLDGGRELKAHGTHWARVLLLGAGTDRGLVVMPEVGDEVLVAFERGDLRQPVVLGGLFGDKQKKDLYEVASDGRVRTRRLVSRSGHTVELSDGDAEGQQHLLLQTAGDGARLRLGADACDLTVPSGTALTIKVGDNSSLLFDGKGKVTLKALDVLVDATASFEVKTAQATVKASTTLTLEGTTKADLKGAMVGVQASGIATLKGSMVQIN